MFRILILEDEKNVSEMITYLLHEFFASKIESIHACYSVEEATDRFNRSHFDLLFLDVKIGKDTSFDFLENVDALHTVKVFISGHEEYMKNAFKQNTVDYLVKPIDVPEFKDTVERALQQAELKQRDEPIMQELQEDKVMMSDIDAIYFLKLAEIVCIEASGPYSIVYLISGDKHTFSKHLKKFENSMAYAGFFRAHKSFLVNGAHVESISKRDGLQILLTTGKQIPMSPKKKEELFEFLQKNFKLNG